MHLGKTPHTTSNQLQRTNKQTQNCPIRNGKGLVYFTAFNIKSFESITAETAGDATYPDEKDEGDALLKFEPMNP